MSHTSERIIDFDSFLQSLNIPKACELKKSIFKKMFLENGVLDATDKTCLKDDIEKIRWLHTLKPSTINIAPYNDQEYEYPEIAILQIELTTTKRLKRIAHFINRSIPYPLILLFTNEIEGQYNLAISLADKRINQADKEKWVVEDSVHTEWINLSNLSESETMFLESINIRYLPFNNFFAFYQALIQRVIAINCSTHSHVFTLDETGMEGSGSRLDKLRELEKLDYKKSEIANKLLKEKQMGRKIDLNTQIKNINDNIARIKGSL